MPELVPLDELRAAIAARGVTADDAELQRVRDYLAPLLPAFAELERTDPEQRP